MHRGRRLITLAGAIAAIATTLSVGTVAAAGPRTVGHVYVNNNSSGQNTIAAFDRHADGSLTPIAGSPFTPAARARALRTARPAACSGAADGRYLLATDPASNQISVLRIKPNGGLQIADVVGSHGTSPVSIAVHGGLVYVANGGAGGSNYTGFRLNAGGHLSHIAGSTFALPDDALPGHVLISPDGRRLVATRVGPNAGPSFLDGFSIGTRRSPDARAGLARSRAQRIGPFGSTFSPTHGSQLFVSNAHDGANAGSVSVYDVAADGSLDAISGSPFADNQTAPCWVAISPDGHALFAVNTAVPVGLALRGRGGRLA